MGIIIIIVPCTHSLSSYNRKMKTWIKIQAEPWLTPALSTGDPWTQLFRKQSIDCVFEMHVYEVNLHFITYTEVLKY